MVISLLPLDEVNLQAPLQAVTHGSALFDGESLGDQGIDRKDSLRQGRALRTIESKRIFEPLRFLESSSLFKSTILLHYART